MSADDIQVGGDHYLKMGVTPWEAMEAWMTREEFIGFLRGSAIAYLARAGRKGSAIEDVEKARHYIDKLIEVLDVQPELTAPDTCVYQGDLS